jgi:hypothetical protein
MGGRFHPATLRAAWWAVRACRRVRPALAGDDLEVAARRLPPVPRLPDSAERGVSAVLRRRGEACLVSSIVRQAWDVAHGRPRDLVIGVTPPSAGFHAHAWLEGDPPPRDFDFAELARRPAS